MKKVVSMNALLNFMSIEKYLELKSRGVLILLRTAPDVEILYDSVPTRYRRRLNAVLL